MRIRQTQVLLALVTTVFCTMAFSSAGTNQAGNPAWIDVTGGSESVSQQPLLLAKVEKVFVCHYLGNGESQTQELPVATANKLTTEKPDKWSMGPCPVISPSK